MKFIVFLSIVLVFFQLTVVEAIPEGCIAQKCLVPGYPGAGNCPAGTQLLKMRKCKRFGKKRQAICCPVAGGLRGGPRGGPKGGEEDDE